MASLYVTEFSDTLLSLKGTQVAMCPAIATTLLSPSSQSSATTAVSSYTRIVRVVGDGNTFINISSSPTAASTGGWLLPAGQTEYYEVRGGIDKVAVVSTST